MSTIREATVQYLVLRRALGYKLRLDGAWLEQFASFLEQRQASYVTTQLALEWAVLSRGQPCHLAHRLSVVRTFAAFRAASDPRTEVPPLGLLAQRFRRKPPYIYTDEEVASLLEAAARLPSSSGLRPRTYTALLGLLVATGLRIGEAVALDRVDVDIAGEMLTVRRSKFGKSRLVPVHASSCHALQCYADFRDRIQPKPKTSSFFVAEHGGRMVVNTVEQTFVRLSREVGLRGPFDRRGPRLHDMRHRFAVTTILRWYGAGLDVNALLPSLSAYLGHGHVTDTYWYLSAVPELMRLVVARLEQQSDGRSS